MRGGLKTITTACAARSRHALGRFYDLCRSCSFAVFLGYVAAGDDAAKILRRQLVTLVMLVLLILLCLIATFSASKLYAAAPSVLRKPAHS